MRRVVAIDAFQSLWLALVSIGSTLSGSEAYQAGRLRLFGDDPDLCLPVYDDLRHLVPPIPPKPE